MTLKLSKYDLIESCYVNYIKNNALNNQIMVNQMKKSMIESKLDCNSFIIKYFQVLQGNYVIVKYDSVNNLGNSIIDHLTNENKSYCYGISRSHSQIMFCDMVKYVFKRKKNKEKIKLRICSDCLTKIEKLVHGSMINIGENIYNNISKIWIYFLLIGKTELLLDILNKIFNTYIELAGVLPISRDNFIWDADTFEFNKSS